MDVINKNTRPFAQDFGDVGAEMSIIETSPNAKDIWKLEQMPTLCQRVIALVPGRSYLVPIAYGLPDEVFARLVALDGSEERRFPEGENQIRLLITGEGVDTSFSFTLTRQGKNFNTFVVKAAENA